MNAFYFVQDRQLARAAGALIALLFIGGCSDPPKNRFQGYVEGEFVYVASPLAGTLETLQVRRGEQVKAGDPLFVLDETAEKAARDQNQAALVLSEAEYARQDKLFRTGVATSQDLDRARSTRDRDQLVFMVEAVFDPTASANLHPGQPVDVQFESKS